MTQTRPATRVHFNWPERLESRYEDIGTRGGTPAVEWFHELEKKKTCMKTIGIISLV